MIRHTCDGAVVEVRNKRDAGYACASANADCRRDIHQNGVAAGQNADLTGGGGYSAAKECAGFALEHHNIHTAGHARAACRTQSQTQQPQTVRRVCGDVHILPGHDDGSTAGVRSHFFAEYQYDNGCADTCSAGNRQSARNLYDKRIVVRFHGCLGIARICPRGILNRTVGLPFQHIAGIDLGAVAQPCSDAVLDHQRVDHAGDGTGSAGGCRSHRDHNHSLTRRRADDDAAPAIRTVRREDAGAVSGSNQERIFAYCGGNGVVQHDRVQRCADADAASAEGQTTRYIIQAGAHVGENPHAAARDNPCVVADRALNLAGGDNHGDCAGDRAPGTGACGGQRHHDGDILALRLHDDVAAGGDGQVAARRDASLPVKHIDADCRACGGSAAGSRHRQRDHQQPAVGLRVQCHIPGRAECHIVAQADVAQGLGDQHADHAGDAGALCGAGAGRQNVDKLLFIHGADGNRSVFAHSGNAGGTILRRADRHDRLALMDDDAERTAHRNAGGRAADTEGHQNQIHIAGRADGDIAVSENGRAVFDIGVDVIFGCNGIEPAADGGGRVGGGVGRHGNGNHHDIRAALRSLAVPCASGTVADGDGAVAQFGGNLVTVAQECQGQADAYCGSARAECAADDADVGVVTGIEGHALRVNLSILLDGGFRKLRAGADAVSVKGIGFVALYIVGISVRILIHVVLCAGQADIHMIPHSGSDRVIEEHHGERAGHGGLGIAGAAHNRACDGLGIVVRGRQEVQQIHHAHDRIGGEIDLHRVALVISTLVNVNDACRCVFTLLIREGGGVVNQIGQIHGAAVVREIHALLLGHHLQRRAGETEVVSKPCFYVVMAVNQSEGCSDPDRSALADADSARAER